MCKGRGPGAFPSETLLHSWPAASGGKGTCPQHFPSETLSQSWILYQFSEQEYVSGMAVSEPIERRYVNFMKKYLGMWGVGSIFAETEIWQ